MLTDAEIRVLYHILDCVGPDLEKNEYGRYELRPARWREYVDRISFSESEYRVFQGLKGKIQGALLGTV